MNFFCLAPSITLNGTDPIIGTEYSLTCTASNTNRDNIYQWRKDGDNIEEEKGWILSFAPLRLSDAGQYSCGIIDGCLKHKDIYLQSKYVHEATSAMV